MIRLPVTFGGRTQTAPGVQLAGQVPASGWAIGGSDSSCQMARVGRSPWRPVPTRYGLVSQPWGCRVRQMGIGPVWAGLSASGLPGDRHAWRGSQGAGHRTNALGIWLRA